MVLAKPNLNIDKDGIITEVDVQWVFAESGQSISTRAISAIVESFEVQITGSGKPCADYPQGEARLYNSGSQDVMTETIILNKTCQGLQYSQIWSVIVAVSGLRGGDFVLVYQK